MKEFNQVMVSPLFWAVIAGSLGIFLMLPLGRLRVRPLGALLAAVGLGLLAWRLPSFGPGAEQVLFWGLSAMTAIAAVATIASRSPVYSAIWFALTLLTTAGLLLLQGALLLGIATVVVYAGAILVMFLFVLMLAQPQGNALCDRLSWGVFPAALATFSAVLIVGGLAYLLGHVEPPMALASQGQLATGPGSVMDHDHHMAILGGRLFSKHLIGVEVAGSLLLAALVGAVVIAIQGKQRQLSDNQSRQTVMATGGQGDE